jgi:putative ABC transport system ATP-binding protein
MTMEAALEARGLARTYRTDDVEVLALRGIDLVIDRGAFVAVTGPSGSGKSTLLHLLGGLERPTAGSVHVGGHRVDDLGERALALMRRTRIGFVFQAFNLVPSLSAQENVALPALLAGHGRHEASERAMTMLDAVGAADRARFAPVHLSGGQQQRVAIARALVNEPDIVLADEPTGNLDSASARDVMRLLRTAADRGQAIVVVTHDPRVAAAADRVVMLSDGLVVDDALLDPARPVEPLLDLGRPS